MKAQMKEDEVIDEKKLKMNEIICAIIGLSVAVITFIFLFAKAISFNIEITEGETYNFSTSVIRILNSDFNITYENTGFLYWNLFNPDFEVSSIKDYQWVVVACSWVSLIGCIASVILYTLFMLGKRTPFFCEMASRCAAIGCGITLLFFIFGEIEISGTKIYAEGVSYNYIVPIIYAVIMVCALVCIKYLCGYSQTRHELLKQAKLEKAAANTIAKAATQANEVQTMQSAAASVPNASSENEKSGIDFFTPSATPQAQSAAVSIDYEAQKKALLAKYVSALHSDDLSKFEQAIKELPPQKYNQLMQQPIKKKTVAILFSIFLGGIGIDRFYVGDAKLGVLKIVGTVVAVLCNYIQIPVLGIIVNLANGIWKIADIFLSYKKCKDKNYENAMAIIRS